jgi:hypothetical protein
VVEVLADAGVVAHGDGRKRRCGLRGLSGEGRGEVAGGCDEEVRGA